MNLSDKFHTILSSDLDDLRSQSEAADLVFNAPESPERDGLISLIYHEGIGVPVNLDTSFEYAEKAAFNGHDALGYLLLGYMCDNAETPDQAEGGPRQKYDHYDAERFYEICAGIDSRWRPQACLWLGDYYMDMAQGGDPEIGVEYYESIAEENAEAAGSLSDYYWDLIMPEYIEDEDWTTQLYKWTVIAARLNPEEYSYRMGWIYADGIGCEADSDKAFELFTDAYTYGDWRGAQAVAQMMQESLDGNSGLTADERSEKEQQISYWRDIAERMRQEELTDSIDELDNTVEED